MDAITDMAISLLWGDLRGATAGILAALGLLVLLRGFTGALRVGSESIRLVTRMRRLMWGGVLLTLALGLWLQQPVLVAIALVIGFEETLEMGIALHALESDPAA